MDPSSVLDWLAKHQATLTWLAGGIAALAGGIWGVARFLIERRDRAARPGLEPASAPAAGRTLPPGQADHDGARLPRGSFALAALGLVLIGIALFRVGDRIEVTNGAVVGGGMSNSTITISPGGGAGGPQR